MNELSYAVRFENVEKKYKGEIGEKSHKIFDGISFSVKSKTTVGLIGANGAGKSTCIKLMLGFIKPDRGKIYILGHSPEDETVRRCIGYLPEVSSFPPNLKITDMLRFVATTCGLEKSAYTEKSREILEKVDLWNSRKKLIRNYSKGMQQRANFALALLNDPKLLILDEPMSGLDPIGRNLISSLIQSAKKEGRSVLFSSHILEDVDRLADEIIILHKGKLLFSGTPQDAIYYTKTNSLNEAYLTIIKNQ